MTMTNSRIKQYADELSDIYMKIEDAKAEAAALIETAKEAGLDTKELKALRKVAKEMVMMSDKLAAKYEDEDQLCLCPSCNTSVKGYCCTGEKRRRRK